MTDEQETLSLCCCEYFDSNNERNHILACCCNCVDLDRAFDSLITGEEITQKRKSRIMSTFQDRLRVPWRGGAKQIAFDAILPIVILPVMFLLASISLLWTIFSFTSVTIFLCVLFNFFIRTIPKTKFFYMWSLTSGVILYCVFEFVVIPFLEILFEENIGLSVLIFGFVFCVYMMKVRCGQLKRLDDETGFGLSRNTRMYNCSLCQINVPEKDHHCVWLDCCVGKHNQCYFVLALFFAVSALLYSSNLTLTSVCHPFNFYKTILLPDDCSDVYQQFELGLSFVSALYSLGVAVLLFMMLLHQILVISIGVSTKDWKKMPIRSKICLGLCASRPHSQGFLRNWSRIICWSQTHQINVNNAI